MILNFQQGIILHPVSNGIQQFLSYDAGYVNLETYDGRTDIVFTQGTENYLFTEASSIQHAWGPIPNGIEAWLYWDIDTRSAVRTFGITYLLPLFSTLEPTKIEDQHWFDLTNNKMMVCKGGHWVNVIRVFACKAQGAVLTPANGSIVGMPFAGSQVGLSHLTVPIVAGRILVDDAGLPIRRANGLFFTTEDEFFVNGSPANTIRLEANILHGTAKENIAKYQVVKFTEFGRINAARYNDTQESIIAMLMEDLNQEETGTLCMQGVITNPEWNWTTVGATLWIHGTQGGLLTETDPHVENALIYKIGKTPVARVISPTSIFFDQGLGGKGDKGEDGTADVPLATESIFGISKLSLAASNALNPIVVGDNDPRNFNDRYPLPHNQAATTITTTTAGILNGANVQANLAIINDAFVKKSGDTMTGYLTLSADPANNLHAATKHYVDSMTLDGLADVVLTTPTTGQVLKFNGANWYNGTDLTSSGIPAGGTTGQVLAKVNNTDYNAHWVTDLPDIPAGGTTGQALVKIDNANYNVQWATIAGGGGDSLWSYNAGTLTPTTNPTVKTAIYSHTLITSNPISGNFRNWTVIEQLQTNSSTSKLIYPLVCNDAQNTVYYYNGSYISTTRDLEGPTAGYKIDSVRKATVFTDFSNPNDFTDSTVSTTDTSNSSLTYTMVRVVGNSVPHVFLVTGFDSTQSIINKFIINPSDPSVFFLDNYSIAVQGDMLYIAYEATYDTGTDYEENVTICCFDMVGQAMMWVKTVSRHTNGFQKVCLFFDETNNILLCGQYNWLCGLDPVDGTWLWSGEYSSVSGYQASSFVDGFVSSPDGTILCPAHARSSSISHAYGTFVYSIYPMDGSINWGTCLGQVRLASTIDGTSTYRPEIHLAVGYDYIHSQDAIYAVVTADGRIWGSSTAFKDKVELTTNYHKIDYTNGTVWWSQNIRNPDYTVYDDLWGVNRYANVIPYAISIVPPTFLFPSNDSILISGRMFDRTISLG